MKILCLLLAVFATALFSCQNSVRNIATPKPTKQGAEISGKAYESLKNGHSVYILHCAQCHEHRLPNTTSLPAWHAQVESMSNMVGLSKTDEQDLQLYLGEFSDR